MAGTARGHGWAWGGGMGGATPLGHFPQACQGAMERSSAAGGRVTPRGGVHAPSSSSAKVEASRSGAAAPSLSRRGLDGSVQFIRSSRQVRHPLAQTSRDRSSRGLRRPCLLPTAAPSSASTDEIPAKHTGETTPRVIVGAAQLQMSCWRPGVPVTTIDARNSHLSCIRSNKLGLYDKGSKPRQVQQ